MNQAEQRGSAPPELKGLSMYEVETLRGARALLAKKPEAVLKYLAGGDTPNRALIALALSAQLVGAKQHHESMKVTTALCRFLNLDKDPSNTNDVEDNHGQDATPGS